MKPPIHQQLNRLFSEKRGSKGRVYVNFTRNKKT